MADKNPNVQVTIAEPALELRQFYVTVKLSPSPSAAAQGKASTFLTGPQPVTVLAVNELAAERQALIELSATSDVLKGKSGQELAEIMARVSVCTEAYYCDC